MPKPDLRANPADIVQAVEDAAALYRQGRLDEEEKARAVGGYRAREANRVGRKCRRSVSVDGAVPGDSHGTDVDAEGQGLVTGQRLYQLIRQSGKVADHTFEIRFLDPGVQAYAFTFG